MFDGARVEELAGTFKMPAEWVDEFVHVQYPDVKPTAARPCIKP
jgi:hypothetical protein